MKTQEDYKALHIKIKPGLYEAVRRHSFDTRTSKAEIVREALREYLEREKKGATDGT